MKGLTTELLGRACRTYFSLAFPDGNIPPAKVAFLELQTGQPLESLLGPPVCQILTNPDGGNRGYAFRLGSAWFPHIKLEAIECGEGIWVFMVDTHDALILDPSHPDAPRWSQLQAANRRLKEQVEKAWEAEGLKTFNGLLRESLGPGPDWPPG
ncbi:MAG: hypothetical protein JO112_13350 [Planctomycetes bacterium]|nr:hypothetical protein [Planctomycetota bacterium]